MLLLSLGTVSFSVSPIGSHQRVVHRSKVYMTVDAASEPVATSAAGESMLPASNVKGVVTPIKRSWPNPEDEFRHGAGNQALAMNAAIDGSVAMLSLDATPAQQTKALPGSEAKVVEPSINRSVPNQDNEFRYGTGSQALAMAAAIDGKVAMMSLDDVQLREGKALPASGANSDIKAETALVKANTKQSEPSAEDFRHGAGGQAFAMSTAIDGSVAMISAN